MTFFPKKNAIIAQNFNDNGDTMSQSLLDLLKAHNPELFDKEGNFKFADFRTALAEADSTFSQETYRLDWRGKSYAKALVYDENRTLLSPNHSHNANNLDSQNVLIQGDNLAVLKHLREAYRKQIKMIYIDPPYNTGSDGFVYQDDRKYTPEQIAQITGESEEYAEYIHGFINAKASSHSAWLTFMYPRLKLARELLKDDGVIFISIDDNEQAQLKLLCDEIFGEGNFVATFPWRKRSAKSDVPFGVSQDYEWILCYAKTDFLAGVSIQRKYHYTDDYPNDGWRLSDLTTQKVEAERPNSAFDLIDPKTGKIYPYNPNRLWGITKDTFDDYYQKGKIVFPDDYDFLKITIPAYRVFESEDTAKSLKKFGSTQALKAISTLLPKEIGMNEAGNKEIIQLFNSKVFSYPKPTELIKFFVDVATNENDLILDFFAGSGTTAHAIMRLNSEDFLNGKQGNRKFICVQLDEPVKPKSEAEKAGFNTIFEITKARIQKSIEKIKAENPDFKGDLGFKEYRIVPAPDNFGILADNPAHGLQLLENLQLSDTDCQNILTTWCVQDGMPLHHTPNVVDLGGYIAYRYDTVLYLLNKGFDTKHLAAILCRLDDTADEFNIDKIVILEPHFDSKAKRELAEAIGQYKPRKGNKLYLIVRNRADKG